MGGGRGTDMITNIHIRNFKTLEDAEFKLGADPVVLIGPNNCGKTSILQALTMWRFGVEEWCHRYTWRERPGKRGPRAVGIPLKEFSALATPDAGMIWHARKIIGVGEHKSQRVRIEVNVSGKTNDKDWNIAAEFVYHGRNIVYCGPAGSGVSGEETPADIAARWERCLPRVAFLQPMSGMSEEEDEFSKPGSIEDRLGKGKTADVLRNICYRLLHPYDGQAKDEMHLRKKRWNQVTKMIYNKFFIQLDAPWSGPRGKIILTYREGGKEYDLSSGGRGFHQTLLLLAYLYSNPNSVILLDEPDAHLEIKRQRSNYEMYAKVAKEIGSQLIIASHSEVVMGAATDHGNVVQVLGGKAGNVDDREELDRLRKWLSSNEWSLFYLSRQDGYVVFLEGKTDKWFLPAFAEKIAGKTWAELIERANIITLGNNDTGRVKNLFRSLRKVLPRLRGYALFDKVPRSQLESQNLNMDCWSRREVENFLLLPEVLYRFAEAEDKAYRLASSKNAGTRDMPLNLNTPSRVAIMREAVKYVTAPEALDNPHDDFWLSHDMKEYIHKVFARYRKKVRGEPWRDSLCHTLVQYMEPDEIPDEVREKIIRLLAVIDLDFNPEESQ